MIRYPVTLDDIIRAVDDQARSWRDRAALRSETIQAAGMYQEASSIWSEVKPVYMKLQRNKCIYCETKLEGGYSGHIQHDLEHFRPKGPVEVWPPAGSGLNYDFATGNAFPEGYYLLAYHLGNYAAACKICNTMLKRSYFPIAGARVSGCVCPEDCTDERPYLIYPLGDQDDDPENIVTFEGVEIKPAVDEAIDSWRWCRGRVIIDFFDLNRDGLQQDRALVIIFVWLAFKRVQGGDTGAAEELDSSILIGARHANCALCFRKLCTTDDARAEMHVKRAREILHAVNQ